MLAGHSDGRAVHDLNGVAPDDDLQAKYLLQLSPEIGQASDVLQLIVQINVGRGERPRGGSASEETVDALLNGARLLHDHLLLAKVVHQGSDDLLHLRAVSDGRTTEALLYHRAEALRGSPMVRCVSGAEPLRERRL